MAKSDTAQLEQLASWHKYIEFSNDFLCDKVINEKVERTSGSYTTQAQTRYFTL